MINFLVESQIKAIDEQWKANHLKAMACWEFGDLLLFCVETFERINRIDEAWREAVLTREERHDPALEDGIDGCYRNWYQACSHFVDALQHFQRHQCEVEHADKFLECLREAKNILKEDSDFFSGDELAGIRDAAIDEYQRGETLDGNW